MIVKGSSPSEGVASVKGYKRVHKREKLNEKMNDLILRGQYSQSAHHHPHKDSSTETAGTQTPLRHFAASRGFPAMQKYR